MHDTSISVDKKPLFTDFTFPESLRSVLGYRFKKARFRRLTRQSSNLFLRGGDVISIDPQVIGVHEPVVTSLIDSFCRAGYSDFLIDIGANIGLTSCQNGKRFQRVDMFEPNPLCCKILEVNSAIALGKTKHHIHSYGLGAEEMSAVLTVPTLNWGGAFIRDKSNSYDSKALANKDGLDGLFADNYFEVEIRVREASAALAPIFSELEASQLKRGVIKIDVEGYEPAVLKGIAQALPSGLKALIVFESWSADFDMAGVLSHFGGRATPYKLIRDAPWKNNWPRLLKALALLLKPRFVNRIGTNDSSDWRGDVVLMVN